MEPQPTVSSNTGTTSLNDASAAVMPLTEHLIELRRRLLFIGVGLFLCTIPAWYLYEPATQWLFAPISEFSSTPPQVEVPLLPAQNQPASSGVNFRSVTAPFATHLRFALWGGALLSSPWWIGQVWAYVAPALSRKEKRAVVWMALPSTLLFASGAGLAVAFFPRIVTILLSIAPEGSFTFIDADSYLSFVMLLVVAIAVSFVFPVAIVGLHVLGVVKVSSLIRGWRWATLGAFTFAAVVNPLPDAWSMILQAAVLLALYWIAVGICAIREKRRIRH